MANEITSVQVSRIVYLLQEKTRATAWVLDNKPLDGNKRQEVQAKLDFDNSILLALGVTPKNVSKTTTTSSPVALLNII